MLPVSKSRFIRIAQEASNELGYPLGTLQGVLEFGYDYPFLLNKQSSITLASASHSSDVETFLSSLVHNYHHARKRVVIIKKPNTIPDPAVDAVLEGFFSVPAKDLKQVSNHHRLSMSAENKIGDLLEIYIAEALEPHGWVWCCGNMVQGVDFFHDGKPVRLLQIKNRSNSENSSSSKIRELVEIKGCPSKIEIWCRGNAARGSTFWPLLPGNSNLSLADEPGFLKFLREYPKKHVAD